MVTPDDIVLRSEDLYSKWGFSDGDLLTEAIWRWEDETGIKAGWDLSRRALVLLVRERLLPVLAQSVEFGEIGGCHNPARVWKVDGREVDHRNPDPYMLGRVSVTVPGGAVREAFERLTREGPSTTTPT